MGKNLKLKKIQNRLQKRQEDYEEICRRRTDNGSGFKRPGSLSGRK